jgi:bacterioferritin-associated ferredoxin
MFHASAEEWAMIVCSCQKISDHDIRSAVEWMRAADPYVLITPGKVYRALGKSPDCGGCVPLFVNAMRACPELEVPVHLRGLRAEQQGMVEDEGRPEGHRISQSGSAE